MSEDCEINELIATTPNTKRVIDATKYFLGEIFNDVLGVSTYDTNDKIRIMRNQFFKLYFESENFEYCRALKNHKTSQDIMISIHTLLINEKLSNEHKIEKILAEILEYGLLISQQ